MGSSVRNFGSLKRHMRRPHVLDVRFFLSHKYFELVWEATKEWHKYSVSKSGDFSHRMVSLFNRAMNFGTAINEKNRDIVAIWHKGDWALGKQHWRFFQLIAKFVKEGSYINLLEEKTTIEKEQTLVTDYLNRQPVETFHFGQWYFNGDCMVERPGKLTF